MGARHSIGTVGDSILNANSAIACFGDEVIEEAVHIAWLDHPSVEVKTGPESTQSVQAEVLRHGQPRSAKQDQQRQDQQAHDQQAKAATCPQPPKPSVEGSGGFAWCVSLDGEIDRDKQQSDRGEVADIDAMRFGEREQQPALGERLHDHQPDSHGGKHKRVEPAPAAGMHGPRHLPHGSGLCVSRS